MAEVSLSWALILGLLARYQPRCTDLYFRFARDVATGGNRPGIGFTQRITVVLASDNCWLASRRQNRACASISILSLLLLLFLPFATNNILLAVVWRFIQGIAGAGGSVLSRSIARRQISRVTMTQFFCASIINDGE
ncbi:hypothetical protein MJ566_06610 [Escherichia coli]|nr:hypothetical protein MJ566_06610 [Escherichia coli]